jgi:cholesterol oxidase
MTGCRVGGKNTLMKNYLHLAERAGAVVHPLTTVTRVRPRPEGGWLVEAVRSGSWSAKRTVRRWTCDRVVLAAGTYGTQRLLHAMKDDGTLPQLSARLGHQTRTNSEAVLAATGDGAVPPTTAAASRSRRRSTSTSTPTSSPSVTAGAAMRSDCCRPCWSTAAAGCPAG